MNVCPIVIRLGLMSVVVALSAAVIEADSHPFADSIVTHVKIWTGDKQTPAAEALAIIGDRIVGVGSTAEIDAWRGSSTKIIDAGGRRVVPGFNDAHVHFVDGGRQLDNVDLKDAATPQEFARRVGEQARQMAAG